MDHALTADLGNSRLKLCAWRISDGALVARRAVADGESDAGAIAEFADAHGPFAFAALSSVATREREQALAAALSRRAAQLVLAPDCGLAIDVREPARVGRDRLYAARGALELTAVRDAGIVVVDAGTALTVDALDASASGRFLGGAIAPGPRSLARALHEHTARLPLVEPAPGAPALGRDTESALRAGVVVGFRGAARELARAIAREAGWTAPHVVVTGGARGLLLEPPLFERPEFASLREDEDLVGRGLLASSRSALAR